MSSLSCRLSPSSGIRFFNFSCSELDEAANVVGLATAWSLLGMALRLPVSQCDGFLRKHMQSAKWISSPLPHIRLPRIAPNNQVKTMLPVASQYSSAEPASSNLSFQGKFVQGQASSVHRSSRSQHMLLHFSSGSYQQVMFDLPTEDYAALRQADFLSWDALARHLSICGRSDQVPGGIVVKQRSTACIPAYVHTMDVFFIPHA
jgi:hypothetical protein